MANIHPKLQIEIDPRLPVPEICAVIAAVMPYHRGQEDAILIGVMEAIDKQMKIMSKGAERHAEPLDEPGRNEADHGELGRSERRVR